MGFYSLFRGYALEPTEDIQSSNCFAWSSHLDCYYVYVCVCFQSDLHIPLSQSIFSQVPFGFFGSLLFKVGELCLVNFHDIVIHVKPLIIGLLIDFGVLSLYQFQCFYSYFIGF